MIFEFSRAEFWTILRKQSDSSPSLILNNIASVHPGRWEVREKPLVFHQAIWPAPKPSQTLFFSLSSSFNHSAQNLNLHLYLSPVKNKTKWGARKASPTGKTLHKRNRCNRVWLSVGLNCLLKWNVCVVQRQHTPGKQYQVTWNRQVLKNAWCKPSIKVPWLIMIPLTIWWRYSSE